MGTAITVIIVILVIVVILASQLYLRYLHRLQTR